MPDTPPRPTRLQRVALWILGALMFYIVALYPNLLMARFQPDDVVHYGFLKWMAVVLILYAVAAQLFFAERPVESRPGRQTLAVTAAILLIVGVFSPIVSFSFVGDVDFFRGGYGDGYILLIMAVASLALAVTGRWKQVLVPALGGLAVTVWTFLGVQDTIAEARSGGSPVLAGNPHEGLAAATMASIQWEWGWILLFAGSGLLVYSAARRDRMEEAPPWATEPAAGEAATAEAAEVEAEAGQAEAGEEAVTAEAAAPAADEPAAPAAEEPAAATAEAAAESPAEAAAADAPAERAAEEATATPAAETPAAEASAAEPEPVTSESDAGTAESSAAPDAGAAATAKAETTATNAEPAPAERAADETDEPEASASKPEGDARDDRESAP